MKHWYWCRITGKDGKRVRNKYRVETILKAHGLTMGQHAKDNASKGLYLVLLPETQEGLELISVQYGVGELTVTMGN